jgi:uncharacterized protein
VSIKQLFQLQELDNEIDARELELKTLNARIGASDALKKARIAVSGASQALDEIKKQQHDLEVQIADVEAKVTPMDKDLYSGRIHNPKELSSLQHEVEDMKKKLAALEDGELSLMGKNEATSAELSGFKDELARVETAWRNEQQALLVQIDKIKNTLAELKAREQSLASQIEPVTLELYRRLRKQKGQAVAKVVQGMCRGCRISLSAAELQRARGSTLVNCSSCGRIIFLD